MKHWALTLLPPVILIAMGFVSLREPVTWWLRGQEIYDEEAIQEWIREARIYTTLGDLVQQYLDLINCGDPKLLQENSYKELLKGKREEVREHLAALGTPLTKMFPSQLPLFPIIYRLEVRFPDHAELEPLEWDSLLPQGKKQSRQMTVELKVKKRDAGESRIHVLVDCTLHAYFQRQHREREVETRHLLLSGLGLLFAVLGLTWVFWVQRRERVKEARRLEAEHQASAAEKRRLEAEILRQEAQRKQLDAERQTLELGSQLWANIGIMAGSYAHNIKNLLVRPNDLLRRCLEEPADSAQKTHMLHEVQQTLGTVTERLQQILQTVRRDPTRSEKTRVDLNAMATEMHRTWIDLAREKWKLNLELDRADDGLPLWIEGDASNLLQALENLLFNARDATFEMRNWLREQARKQGAEAGTQRQALIDAASWKGSIRLRTRRAEDGVILEVEDNGIGMTEEVKQQCVQTHFSTKRNNALFAGMSAGMGLGLSFVTMILSHHPAKLEIESQPLAGAKFRIRFPKSAG